MRTTLDIDDGLLARAQAQFPAGTPKTVILEEALRRLLQARPPKPDGPARDPRLEQLAAEGRVSLARARGPLPPRGEGLIPLDRLLADLAGDREDR